MGQKNEHVLFNLNIDTFFCKWVKKMRCIEHFDKLVTPVEMSKIVFIYWFTTFYIRLSILNFRPISTKHYAIIMKVLVLATKPYVCHTQKTFSLFH